LVEDFSYNVIATDTTVTIDFGTDKIIYIFRDNVLADIKIESVNIPNAKFPKDVFNSYRQCVDAITDQAAHHICGGCGLGKYAFEAACAAIRPCAGAGAVACTAYVLSLWWDGKDGWGKDFRSQG
jgi:hypothetical protein